jgi:STE24 endopeptidase
MEPTPLPIELLAWFTPEDLARSALRSRVELGAWLVELGVDMALLLSLAFGPLGRRLWRACERLRVPSPHLTRALGPSWLAGAAFGAALGVGRELAGFPVALGRDWFFLRSLGLSHETFARFAGLLALDTLLGAFALALLGLALPAVRARWPERWWLAVGAVAAAGLVVSAVVEPLWLRAAFEVRPLPPGELRNRLESLLNSSAERTPELVMVDASRHGTAVNALVTGFGPTRSVVLTDTLLALGDDAVAGAVMHEIGHRRAERLPGRLALAALGTIGLLWLVERLLRLGLIRGAPAEVPALAFAIAVLVVGGAALAPVRAAAGRAEEREADRVELAARRDYRAYIAENVRLARANGLEPEPSAAARLFATHPSPAERIGLALWYESHMKEAP